MNSPLSSQERQTGGGRDTDGTTATLDLLIKLARRKRLILGLPIAFAVVAVAITLALPNVYLATAQIMPPQQTQSTATAMLNQLGGLASSAGGWLGIKNPSDLYVGLLSSRTVADNLIQRFDLKKHYDLPTVEKSRRALERNTSFKAGKNGLIFIGVEDRDPKLSALMANAYVEELDKLLGSLAVTEASYRRKFFENALKKSLDAMAVAETKLKAALDAKGLASVEFEGRAIVETVARLRAYITAKEIQLASMKAFVTPDHAEYKRVAEELASMRGKLFKLENGTGDGAKDGNAASDQAGVENIKLLREVKYHQMLQEILAKQYEAARLDESKDIPIVQTVDKAVEPETKSWPARTKMVVGAALAGLLAAVLWSLLAEWVQAARREHAGGKLNELKSALGMRA
jgi:tyrosine-protein kinase Etk/Wzc